MTKLFVSGLAQSTTGGDLLAAFAGSTGAMIATNGPDGPSRGYACVTYATEAEAIVAQAAMNGATVGGRTICVALAGADSLVDLDRPNPPPPDHRRGA